MLHIVKQRHANQAGDDDPTDASSLPSFLSPLSHFPSPFAARYSFVLPLADALTRLGGGEYRSQVCAISVLNASSCSHSDGFLYDPTPPTYGEVCIETPKDGPQNCVQEQVLLLGGASGGLATHIG